MQWSKDLKSAGGVPNCTGSAGCFSRLWAPTRYKFRLRSAKPSESQRSRSRFHWRNAQKQPTRNISAKKGTHQEDLDSGYLFSNRLQHLLSSAGLLPRSAKIALTVPSGNPSSSQSFASRKKSDFRAKQTDPFIPRPAACRRFYSSSRK